MEQLASMRMPELRDAGGIHDDPVDAPVGVLYSRTGGISLRDCQKKSRSTGLPNLSVDARGAAVCCRWAVWF